MTYTRKLEPTQIAKGEQAAWTRTFDDFPASLYSLEYRFRSSVGVGLNVAATADGDAFDALITATASAAFGGTGLYTWQAWLTEIAETNNKFVVAEGRTRVTAGYAHDSLAAVDERTDARKILDALKAARINSATGTQLSYEISTPAGTRRVQQMSPKELDDAISRWTGIVANEEASERVRQGKPFGKRFDIVVRER